MDFTEYLQDLPVEQLKRLYDSPWTCQAVLRSLPSLCQHLVLILLFPAEPVPRSYVHQSVLPSASAERDKALEQLRKLQLLTPQRGTTNYSLNATFRARVQQSLVSPLSLGVAETTAVRTSGTAANAFGESQWQKVLLALVNGRKASLKPHASLTPLDIRTIFRSAGLIDDSHKLTDLGFHFLFLDVYSQLWKLLQQYLMQLQASPEQSLADALSFLLQLSFRKARQTVGVSNLRSAERVVASPMAALGSLMPDGLEGNQNWKLKTQEKASQPVEVRKLGSAERVVASHMAALGLLMPEEVEGTSFLCPTFLAALLCGGPGATAATASTAGYIVVETSFRVYAYTSSPVQIAILQLFVRTDCLLPNMFVGTLTARSVTSAIRRGISGDVIIRYLKEHRHAKVAHRTQVLPEAVGDQILLWERELNRLKCTSAVLYEAFESKAMFDGCVETAEALGAVLMKDTVKRRLVLKVHAHDAIKAKIQEIRQQGFL